jgi:hypothetical protein
MLVVDLLGRTRAQRAAADGLDAWYVVEHPSLGERPRRLARP